jgi:alkylation response protein AidB-like acyl-CoA dehydrogenase
MKFELTSDQRDFATMLQGLLTSANAPAAARAWAAGDHESGVALWRKLADAGVSGLLAEDYRVEHVIAMEAIGNHAVPGPWIESAAYLATCPDETIRKQIAAGAIGTVAAPPATPYALDADVAELVVQADASTLSTAIVGEPVTSVDPVRHLFSTTASDQLATTDLGAAWDSAALATSAQLLGAGERMLADSVTYVKQRTQFGRPIGSYQAIKHALADVRIALDFARPLVYAAALHPLTTSDDRMRDVSAAKVLAGDAATLAARTALQVHGAIGYTREYELSLWLLRVRGLVSTWGTAGHHRGRILEILRKDR